MSKPVLLVEGNPDDERLALHAMKKNGLGEEEVAVARDGSEALEYLFGARTGRGADGLPGLVLLDQRLPGVDGPEVLRRLRADDRTASLPLVVLTAGDLPETPDDYGVWAFIRKPLTPEKLAEAARKLGVRGLLPGEATSGEKQAVISEPSQAASRGSTPLRVLLVEDSEDDAALILRALRRGGHEPLCRRVETRAGMETALAEEEWDILVSDYHLPAFSAMDALEIARESGLDLPFIVVSGKIGEDVAVEVMRAGAHDYVMKANLARLGPAVEREVREARGRRERRRAEAALHESEQRFRSLVLNSSDITVVLGARGTILYESPAVERVLGYTPEERLGRKIFDLIHPDDLGRVSDALARSLEEPGIRPPVEYRVRHKDGSWRYFEATGNNLLSDPLVTGIVVNTRDITKRKRAEEKLHQQMDLYDALLAAQSAVGEGLLLIEDQRIVYANEAFSRISGYDAVELAALPSLFELIPSEDRAASRERLCRRLSGQRMESHLEIVILHKSGRRVDLEVGFELLHVEGRVRRIAVVRDVSERKRSEEALKESEERFRSLVQNTSDVITILEADGTVRYESPAIERVLGYRPEELVGKNVLDYVYPEDREYLSDVFGEEVRNTRGVQMRTELRFLHADGSWRHLEAVVNNLIEDPSVAGIVVNSHDITERKQTEESLRNSLGMLIALYEGNRILSSTLELQEIGARLLEIMCRVSGVTTAVISLRNAEHLYVWQSIGLENLWPKTRYTPEVRESLNAALENETTQIFRPSPPDGRRVQEGEPTVGLCMPLRTRERTLGVLEAYGFEALVEKGTVAVLESLTNHATSALENARLYGELAEREHRLEDLLGKLMTAQEEERRRVAYEVHDGLAQVATAAHQHLQAFARFHLPDSEESRKILYRALELVQQTVGDARRIIANLRPTTLDDFGLQAAVRLEVEALRAEDWHISFEGTLRDDERLPFAVETALFRIVQEALTNIRKHANTKHVRLSLDRLEQSIRLSVWDWGQGFDPATLPDSGGPGERIGLASMRERVALLGGDFQISSHPGAGTLITVNVPLPKQREADRESDDAK